MPDDSHRTCGHASIILTVALIVCGYALIIGVVMAILAAAGEADAMLDEAGPDFALDFTPSTAPSGGDQGLARARRRARRFQPTVATGAGRSTPRRSLSADRPPTAAR